MWNAELTTLSALHSAAFGWALACCGRDRDDASDVLQDVYFKLLSGSVRWDGRASLKTFVFGVIRLTAMERQTFLLKHIEGWRLEEIAETLQTNANNAKQALFRAVRKLRVDLHVWRGES